MADPVSWMMIASTALSAGGAIMGGNAADSAARSEGAQLDYAAGQQRASGQRAAIEQQRQAKLQTSRLQAVAGGGGGDVTAVNMAADLAGEGEYRALSALYDGEGKAHGLEVQATATRNMGAAKQKAGYIGAVSSVLSSGAQYGMYKKYGRQT